jgi:hypothetical protein
VIVLFLGNLATTLEGAKIMHIQGTPKKKYSGIGESTGHNEDLYPQGFIIGVILLFVL